ncbi:hypothetical protein Esti_006388 [Eimeria stiedai]
MAVGLTRMITINEGCHQRSCDLPMLQHHHLCSHQPALNHLTRSVRLVERLEARRLGLASAPLSLSQISNKDEENTAFRPPLPSLHLKSTLTGHGSRRAAPFATSRESASSSSWEPHGLLRSERTQPTTLTLKPGLGKSTIHQEPLRRVPGSGLWVNGTGDGAIHDPMHFAGDLPSASTTANSSPQPSTLTTSGRRWGSLSGGAAMNWLEGADSTTQLDSSQAPSLSVPYGTPPLSRLGSYGVASRMRPTFYQAAAPNANVGAAQHGTAGAADTPSLPQALDASSRMRAVSSSALKVSGMAAPPGNRIRCFSPGSPAGMSTSLSQLHTSVPLQRPLGSRPLGVSLLENDYAFSQAGRHGASAPRTAQVSSLNPVDDEGFSHSLNRGEASPAAAFVNSSRGGAQRLHAYGAARQDRRKPLSVSSLVHATGRDTQHVVMSGFESAEHRHGLADQSASGLTRVRSNLPVQAATRSAESLTTVGSRTERVKAYLGFLKDLYVERDLIPAASVVDCLATLASYSQGLPAPTGDSLPWCCIGEQEISPASSDPICLKDRVVVKLLNTLLREQLLRCAQASSLRRSQLGESHSAEADEAFGELGSDPLALVLVGMASGTVRVSLQPSNECGLLAGSSCRSLIPLGSCSSVALAVSSLETLSRQHVPVGASLSHSAGSKVHLCYSSLLRWLWEEVHTRRQHSEPFDLCTCLIACEACSPSIVQERECSAVLPQASRLSLWLNSCNLDFAVLLLLSLASRPTRPSITSQLLESTAFALDKCSPVGLAAWIRASAVMGLSSLEKPALFGRVLNALTRQMPQMPLGTVLADVLWGLTLCGIPSMSVFRTSAWGIARSLHMFELDDLSLIGCCYALQMRGFTGVSGDKGRWSYRGNFLPPDFYRRLSGLKAYCLLACVKMADTGPTPLLGEPREPIGALEDPFHRERLAVTEGETPEELLRMIVRKCQNLKCHMSLQACRLLDFAERIMETPSYVDDAILHPGVEAKSVGAAVNTGDDSSYPGRLNELYDANGDCWGPNPHELPKPAGQGGPPLRDVESCLPPKQMPDGSSAAPHPLDHVAQEDRAPSGTGAFTHASSSELSNDRQFSAAESLQKNSSSEACETASSTELSEGMWGDQYVPAPAVLSALHTYGAEAQMNGPLKRSLLSSFFSLFERAASFGGSCVWCLAQAVCGYIFLVVAIYAFSLFS